MRGAAALCLGVRASLALAPRAANACTDEIPPPFPGFEAIPHAETVAPTNTRIWIPVVTDPSALHVRVAGLDVEFDAATIEVDADYGVMFVLTPRKSLPSGSSVTVSEGMQMLTQFTVGTAADEMPPPPPVLEHIDINSGYFGAFWCVDDSVVAIRAAYDADLLILDGQQGSALPGHAFGLKAPPDGVVRAIDLPEGEHELRLLAVDQAGNTTAVTVPPVTVPAQQSGCSATRPAGATWLLALLGIIGLPRTRRQSVRAQRKPTCENRRLGS